MVQQQNGVIVGTSQAQEWLLPWWWMHYSQHNNYPVTFIDFGDLSPNALQWCERRGRVISLPFDESIIAPKAKIDPEKAEVWEKTHPKVWELRPQWYKKPFALLKSPYQKTVWLDPDCQVRGSIQPLFDTCQNSGGFAVAPEPEFSQKVNLEKGWISAGQMMFNAGVIVFRKDSKIVQEWASRIQTDNHLFCSDQQLLSHLLYQLKLSFTSLSPLVNWTVPQKGIPSEALILHWWGSEGKKSLRLMIQILTHQMHFNLSFDNELRSHEVAIPFAFP